MNEKTLRRLIREVVLAEMSIYDRYDNLRSSLPTRITGDPRWSIIEDWIEAERGVNSTAAAAAMKAWFEEVMGQVVDNIWVDFGGWVTVFGPGFPWDNELKANALALTREELADMFYGRGAGRGLNEMRMPDMGEPSSDYHRTIEAWLQGEDISSRDFSRALETWFAVDKDMPGTRVSAIWSGGPIVLKGPGFAGGEIEMEIEDLEHAFYG